MFFLENTDGRSGNTRRKVAGWLDSEEAWASIWTNSRRYVVHSNLCLRYSRNSPSSFRFAAFLVLTYIFASVYAFYNPLTSSTVYTPPHHHVEKNARKAFVVTKLQFVEVGSLSCYLKVQMLT